MADRPGENGKERNGKISPIDLDNLNPSHPLDSPSEKLPSPGQHTRGSYAEILDDQVDRPLSQPSSRSNSQIDTTPEPENSNQQQTTSFINDSNVEDIKHFVKQIYYITIPVLICIVLVIWWVHVREGFQSSDDSSSSPFGFVTIDGDTTEAKLGQGIINALIIIAVIIVMTIIFVILFWFGFHKVIFGILIFTVVMTLGGQGGIFIWYQLEAVNVPIDWITFMFVCWNFTLVGIWVVFKTGPLRVQQFYLIVLSALMAFVFTQIDEWTTWVLLAFLVIWDLVAVLTPCGPLRLLIEASNRQNVEIPALLYSVTMLYFMADNGESSSQKKSKKEKKDKKSKKEKKESGETSENGISNSNNNIDNIDNIDNPTPNQPVSQLPTQTQTQSQSQSLSEAERGEALRRQLAEMEADEEEDERNGLKLGLGDFVFYSVLVGRAAMHDWMTLFACIVAVLTGLNGTIILLAIFQKALPALPFSLTLGLIFYFLTSLVVVPFQDVLQRDIVFV